MAPKHSSFKKKEKEPFLDDLSLSVVISFIDPVEAFKNLRLVSTRFHHLFHENLFHWRLLLSPENHTRYLKKPTELLSEGLFRNLKQLTLKNVDLFYINSKNKLSLFVLISSEYLPVLEYLDFHALEPRQKIITNPDILLSPKLGFIRVQLKTSNKTYPPLFTKKTLKNLPSVYTLSIHGANLVDYSPLFNNLRILQIYASESSLGTGQVSSIEMPHLVELRLLDECSGESTNIVRALLDKFHSQLETFYYELDENLGHFLELDDIVAYAFPKLRKLGYSSGNRIMGNLITGNLAYSTPSQDWADNDSLSHHNKSCLEHFELEVFCGFDSNANAAYSIVSQCSKLKQVLVRIHNYSAIHLFGPKAWVTVLKEANCSVDELMITAFPTFFERHKESSTLNDGDLEQFEVVYYKDTMNIACPNRSGILIKRKK